MTSLLAIDLGGTKSRVARFRLSTNGREDLSQEVYKNEKYAGIAQVIEAYRRQYPGEDDYLCIALAGVVEKEYATLTNLDWHLEKKELLAQFSCKDVFFLNDLTALAAALPYLGDDEVVEIKPGSMEEEGIRAVVAPGTGLGQGYLVAQEGHFLARGCEGGHAGFSPRNEEELRFASWMLKRSGPASAEQVCAGPAITLLYRFYTEALGYEPASSVREKAKGEDDLAPIVVDGAAAEPPCPVCEAVLTRYLAILGAECANFALKLYARGGLYIGGGVILHLLEAVSLKPLVQAFTSNAKMGKLLETIPIKVITKEDAHLQGIVHFAETQLKISRDSDPSR